MGEQRTEIDEEAFRQEIRDYIAANKPDLPYRTGTRSPEDLAESTVLRDWGRQIYAAGFYGADWPVEFGGSTPGSVRSHWRWTHPASPSAPCAR